MQILDVKALDNKEEIEKRFQHLFDINKKENGGTLYLQSKVSCYYRSNKSVFFRYTEQKSA
jgi:hypothetical protein